MDKRIFNDMPEGMKQFVRELAEEEAGHPLTDEGCQFWLDLYFENNNH